jgi:tetratricopeptide (TPR) repeat protein
MQRGNRHSDPVNRRLDSWKEIAAFFGKDERTVRRWETERTLPVHRMPGKARGSVYAFTEELSKWLNTPDSPHEEIQGRGFNGNVKSNDSPDLNRSGTLFSGKVLRFSVAAVVVLILAISITWFVRHSAFSASKAPNAKRAPNAEALDLYLKGRYEWNKRTPESLPKAVDYFTQAIVRDPSYAQAYAGLADTYNLLREYTSMPSTEAYPRAIAAAKRAVELDDSLSEAHRALAFASFYWTWDFPGAEREFKRAIELNPKDATAYHWYATSLLPLGRYSAALDQIELARQLDPGSIAIQADRAFILYYAGKKEESVSIIKQLETTDPTFLSPHRYRAYIALAEGDYLTYIAESRGVAELTHDTSGLEISRAADLGYSQGGSSGMLKNILPVQKKYYEQGLISAYSMADTYALLGKSDEALHYLEEDYKKHDPGIIGIRGDLIFSKLHDIPAFRDLISRIGLPPI